MGDPTRSRHEYRLVVDTDAGDATLVTTRSFKYVGVDARRAIDAGLKNVRIEVVLREEIEAVASAGSAAVYSPPDADKKAPAAETAPVLRPQSYYAPALGTIISVGSQEHDGREFKGFLVEVPTAPNWPNAVVFDAWPIEMRIRDALRDDRLIAALRALADAHELTIAGEGFDPEHCDCPVLERARAALAALNPTR